MESKLPKFSKPPVVETVLGVSFAPLSGFELPHFGLYWNEIKDTYPKFSVQPSLPNEIESFGAARKEITLKFGRPDDRCWFIEDAENWLIQLQNSHFLSNWRNQNSPDYPNYEGFLDRFQVEWNRLTSFLTKQGIDRPVPSQVEVSYVNHIETDDQFSNLPDVFPVWKNLRGAEQFLPPPEGVGLNMVHVIPDNRGRLYLAIQPVLRHSDLAQVIQFSLTAKVIVADNLADSLLQALNLGHEWVVRGFTDFTSEKMHALWERMQ